MLTSTSGWSSCSLLFLEGAVPSQTSSHEIWASTIWDLAAANASYAQRNECMWCGRVRPSCDPSIACLSPFRSFDCLVYRSQYTMSPSFLMPSWTGLEAGLSGGPSIAVKPRHSGSRSTLFNFQRAPVNQHRLDTFHPPLRTERSLITVTPVSQQQFQ